MPFREYVNQHSFTDKYVLSGMHHFLWATGMLDCLCQVWEQAFSRKIDLEKCGRMFHFIPH